MNWIDAIEIKSEATSSDINYINVKYNNGNGKWNKRREKRKPLCWIIKVEDWRWKE